MSLTESQIDALISLLADRDTAIAARCRRHLVAAGPRAIGAIEAAIESGPSEVRAPARAALAAIRGAGVDRDLLAMAASSTLDLDLETGAILIARTRDPDLDGAAMIRRLDELAAAAAARMLDREQTEDVVAALRSTLAEEAGLTGNHHDYYDPANSYLDRVLERGLGIPISLCVVWILVASRLGVALHGVGMPRHFLCRLDGGRGVFLDPFGGGRELRVEDCLDFLDRSGFGRDEELLAPTPSRYILARMLANLQLVFKRRGDVDSAERYGRLFDAMRRIGTP
jgi:regulator of sirC expression with transglutaminase-like and TPR domain